MDERKTTPTTKGADRDKKLEKVTTGTVKIKKKGKAAKLAQIFFVEDLKSVASYVGMQILVPAMKKMFVDMVNSAANSLVNGFGTYTNGKKAITSNISYRPYLEARDPRDMGRSAYVPNRSVYDYGEVVFETKEDADHILDMLAEIISQYNVATVADLYQLVGWSPNNTDYDWGWTSVNGSQVIRGSDGRFTLRLPRVRPING